METSQIPDSGGISEEKASPETVWALLREVGAEIRETNAGLREVREMQRDSAERQKEIDRLMKENAKQMKETDRRLGLYDNRYGKMLEHMVKPNLVKTFCKLGFQVTKASQNIFYKDENDKTILELDFALENGDKVIIVEVKSRLTTEDITLHTERMRKVKAHAELNGDNRIHLGAVAGIVINDNEMDFALKSGFYVLQPSGKTFAVTVPEGAYAPKEW